MAQSFHRNRSSPMRSPNLVSQGPLKSTDLQPRDLPVIDDLVGLGEERKEESEDDYFALKAERIRNNESSLEPQPEINIRLQGMFPIRERPDSV